ncbi:MAG: hypothetical protein ACK55I_38975, partial [bacterium]
MATDALSRARRGVARPRRGGHLGRGARRRTVPRRAAGRGAGGDSPFRHRGIATPRRNALQL